MKKIGGNFGLFCICRWSIIKDTISVEILIFSCFNFSIAPPTNNTAKTTHWIAPNHILCNSQENGTPEKQLKLFATYCIII